MADRNIKIKIQIVGLKEIDAELQAVTGTTTKLNTVQNKLEANIKAHNNLIGAQTKAEATLNTTNKERYKSLLKTRTATQENTKAIKLEQKATAAEEGSYDELSAKMAINLKLRHSMSKAQRENTEAGKALTKTINSQRQELKDLDAETGTSVREVGGYDAALDKFGGKYLMSLKGIKSGFSTMKGVAKGAFSSIKTGLISTGLIIFSIAVAALYGYFSKVETAAKSLEGVFAGLGAIVDTVVEAGLKLTKAFGFLLKGDLKGAAEEAGSAMDGLSGDSLKSAYNDGKKLVEMAWELEQANTAATLSNAENKNIIAEQLLISRDLTKSEGERRAAVNKAGDAEREILATNTAMKQKALDIALLELESTPKSQRTEEQRLAVAQARADVLDDETTSLGKQRELQNRINTLNSEAAATKVKEAQAVAEIAKAKEKEFNDFSASILKEQALQKKANDDKLKVQEDWLKASDALDAEFEADVEADEEAADLKLEATLERMQADREAIAAFDLELAESEEEAENETYKSNMVKLEARRKNELDAAKKAGVNVKEAEALINAKFNKAEISETKAHNKALEDLQKEKNAVANDSFNNAIDTLQSFLGDSRAAKMASLAIDKGFAIADIWMNTAVANAAAVAAFPLTLGQPWVGVNTASAIGGTAGVVASAAKGISEINSASKFALGGFIGGASHSNGGTIVEGENGEYIVNKRTMSDPNMAASIIGMNNAGNAGGSQSGLSASDVAKIVIDSIKSIPVVVKESDITDLQKEVLLREGNL